MPLRRGFVPLPPPTEVEYARRRVPDRTYASKTFVMQFPRESPDFGENSRFVWKVFDCDEPENFDDLTGLDREEHVLSTTPGGRKQLRVQITRQSGNIREIKIQKVPTDLESTTLKDIITLNRKESARLILLAKALDYIPVEGDEETIRIEDQILNEIFTDTDALARIYEQSPERYRQIVEDDPGATDVLALASRRQAVEEFRQLLTEPDYFAEKRGVGGKEAVWQRFMEANPWILGVGLSGQLLTAWDNDKLEKTVAGFSVSGPGKRTDALLRTTGSIRSLVFAEIKHHETDILDPGDHYRPGCWGPSRDLAGGVVQVQQTVHLAAREIGERLFDKDDSGAETGQYGFLLRPRSFLILGHMNQLRGEAGVHTDKFRSFEMYRRNLYEPEVLTFDELLARAEWHVTLTEDAVSGG